MVRIVRAVSDCQVQRNGNSRRVSEGQTFPRGERLIFTTGANSRLEVNFAGSLLRLGPNTVLASGGAARPKPASILGITTRDLRIFLGRQWAWCVKHIGNENASEEIVHNAAVGVRG